MHCFRQGAPQFAFLAAAALAASSCGCGRGPEPAAKREAKTPAGPKIVQFYASPPVVARGGRTLLCYGVENAGTVRIRPEVEPLRPSLSRCIADVPGETTTYTLTAEGPGGSATATLMVEVERGARAAPPPPPPAAPASPAEPVIASFRAEKKDGPGGALTLLCYEVESAEAVQIEPAVMPRSGAVRGCLGVDPQQPTTYIQTAFGRGGRTARRALKVNP